jgi:CHAD domain-containing protein
MGMQLKRLQKPLQKLRKEVKGLTEDSSVEEVHKLRTLTRRTEAMAAALRLDQDEPARTLLKDLAPYARLPARFATHRLKGIVFHPQNLELQQ